MGTSQSLLSEDGQFRRISHLDDSGEWVACAWASDMDAGTRAAVAEVAQLVKTTRLGTRQQPTGEWSVQPLSFGVCAPGRAALAVHLGSADHCFAAYISHGGLHLQKREAKLHRIAIPELVARALETGAGAGAAEAARAFAASPRGQELRAQSALMEARVAGLWG